MFVSVPGNFSPLQMRFCPSNDDAGLKACFVGFEDASNCAISENVPDTELVGIVDPFDYYWTVLEALIFNIDILDA